MGSALGVGACGSSSTAATTTSTCDGVGEMCRLAGTGEQAKSDDGMPALETAFYFVSQVRKGPDGRTYVMDQNNYRLRVIEANGDIATVAGTGDHLAAIDGMSATTSPLLDPIDFVYRPDGRTVIVEWHDTVLVEIGLDGNIHVIAGKGPHNDQTVPPFNCSGGGDGGPAIDAGICELAAVAIDQKGRLFLADDSAHQIRMIDTDGTISTLAGDGQAAYDGDGGPATLAHLDQPTALAVDPDGNLLIADTANHVVRRIDMGSGLIDTIVGSHVPGFSGDGGPCKAAQLNEPGGVAVDTDGTIYIADSFNLRIRRVDLAGDLIDTFAGIGTDGLNGDDGPALDAQLRHPSRMSITNGVLYFGDELGSIARSIRLHP